MYLVYTFFSLFVIAATSEINDKCRPTAEITNGSCKLITDCRPAYKSVMQTAKHPFKRCGFYGDMEIVCCPNDSNYEVSTPSPQDKYGEPQQRDLRIADRECQKLVDTIIPPLGLHIIGGERASLGEFPHMVALGFDEDDGYSFKCGASLISEDYAITAAHCVETLEGIKPRIARLGVVEIGGTAFNPNTDIMIEKIIVHPEYARKTKYHDIALLKLEKSVTMSSNLNPICLYTKMDDPNVPLTITGWGKSSTTRDITSSILLKANVSVVARAKCGQSYTDWRRLPEGIARTQICAGDDKGRYDTCQGDSGGPLQALTATDSLYRLIGITSFGRGCASTVPGVYTRVAHYLDWIEPIVWPNP